MCPKCKAWKPLTDYYRKSVAPDGHQSWCKRCLGSRTRSEMNDAPSVAARNIARKRWGRGGIREWSLTAEEYARLVSRGCYVCASPIPSGGAGLDRMDNDDFEYALGKVLPCCGRCNQMRNRFMTVDEVLKFLRPAMLALEEERAEAAHQDAVASGLVGPLLCPGTRDLHERCRGNRHLLSGGWHVLWPDLDPD